jgi:hypothetical protein
LRIAGFIDGSYGEGILIFTIIVVRLILFEAVVIEVGGDVALRRFLVASFGMPSILVETVLPRLLHLAEELHTANGPLHCVVEVVTVGIMPDIFEDIDGEIILLAAILVFLLLLDELVGAFVSDVPRFEVRAGGEKRFRGFHKVIIIL